MKKKALFLLPFLVLGLSGCNDVDDDDISFAPGTVIPDPEQHTGEGHGEDQTTDDSEGPTITGITEVVSAPEKLDIEDGIEVTDVKVRVTLSNGSTLVRCPNSLTYDTAGKEIGDLVEVTAHIFEHTIVFNCELTEMPNDKLTPSLPGAPSSTTAINWQYSSTTFDAQYDLITSKNSGALNIGASAGAAGRPGIVSTHSGGRIKKIKVDWEQSTTDTASLLIFCQTTPFADVKDIVDLQKKDAFTVLHKTEETFTYKFTEEQNYFYIGFKAADNACKLNSISIYWDDEVDAPTLSSMAFTAESSVRSEVGLDEWDFSNVSVKGTYSDETEVDITKMVDFSSSTAVPQEVTEELDVSVTATYQRDTSIKHTDFVKGSVAAGLAYAAKWSFAYNPTEAEMGGELTTSTAKDGSNNWNADTGSSGAYNYMQICADLAGDPYWTTSPSKVKFFAVLGGGTTKTFTTDETKMHVVLLGKDSGGNLIELGSPVILTSEITVTTGSEFSVDIPAQANVYGVKLYHNRVGTHKVRYFSIALRYEA